MKTLLLYVRTKDALTELCSNAIVAAATEQQLDVIVAYRNKVQSTQPLLNYLSSTHEEADTKLIRHTLYASPQAPRSLTIFTSDTDVLILALAYSPGFPAKTSVTLLGSNRCELHVHKLYYALREKCATTLLGLHSLSGSDITESFSGKGKTTFQKTLTHADDDVCVGLIRKRRQNST